MAQTIPPNVADQLLDQLSTDGDFREQFVGDPVGTLKGLGVDVDPSGLPLLRKLPSKDVLKANRALYRSKMTGTAEMAFGMFSPA